jgi:hypothetical protein
MAQSPQPANDRHLAIPRAGRFLVTNMGLLETEFHSLSSRSGHAQGHAAFLLAMACFHAQPSPCLSRRRVEERLQPGAAPPVGTTSNSTTYC